MVAVLTANAMPISFVDASADGARVRRPARLELGVARRTAEKNTTTRNRRNTLCRSTAR